MNTLSSEIKEKRLYVTTKFDHSGKCVIPVRNMGIERYRFDSIWQLKIVMSMMMMMMMMETEMVETGWECNMETVVRVNNTHANNNTNN